MIIRKAEVKDIESMVTLSSAKRDNYEKAQPQFWKRNSSANKIQTDWFSELLKKENYFLLVAEIHGKITGFIIGQNVTAPEVYNPGGFTLMIDDFCVRNSDDWNVIGKKLLESITAEAKEHGATQMLIVCGHHDKNKHDFLKNHDLSIASEWYVKGI